MSKDCDNPSCREARKQRDREVAVTSLVRNALGRHAPAEELERVDQAIAAQRARKKERDQ
ncbi:hypothetical protein [Marinitenerispora sediminis]|uniref:Uncharacterized protein n=1 Tax=Marinitenerispora sediminis TaxID=1931232 RepID=A0A368T6L2_9ACTN|nr:hypothetical protein [Marinitenerispora sediminis]RCV51182.1 hypothetical protein DEF23_20885 [Marinitenerispora sediminis]RCV59337.1 hypothetical protein DEF24_10220 [Marinitenerispora sediminis]